MVFALKSKYSCLINMEFILSEESNNRFFLESIEMTLMEDNKEKKLIG